MHKFVIWTFLGYKDMEVNHKDGNKCNNKIENLEYVTGSENIQHAVATGLVADKKNGKTSKAIKQIKDGVVIAVFPSIHEAERQTRISKGNITMVLKGQRPLASG